MKHAIIGTVLILYSLFFTPAVIEFTDILLSPVLVAGALAAGIPDFIITLWFISGYIALIVGVGLLGHSIFRRLPTIATGAKNPVALVLLIVFIASVICLWFAYVA